MVVAPIWPNLPWYPQLLESRLDFLIILPQIPDLLANPAQEIHTLIKQDHLHLATRSVFRQALLRDTWEASASCRQGAEKLHASVQQQCCGWCNECFFNMSSLLPMKGNNTPHLIPTNQHSQPQSHQQKGSQWANSHYYAECYTVQFQPTVTKAKSTSTQDVAMMVRVMKEDIKQQHNTEPKESITVGSFGSVQGIRLDIALDIRFVQVSTKGVTFYLPGLTKTR